MKYRYTPSMNLSVSNLRQCQTLCLNQVQCLTITYNQNTKQCELFANVPSQYGDLIAEQGFITMIAISGRAIPTLPTANLVQNGDAETGNCTEEYILTAPPVWSVNGTLSQALYNESFMRGFLNSSLTPSAYGKCFFYGFTSASSTMQQRGNLSSYADLALIDNRTVQFSFSAWLGGMQSQDDSTEIKLTFSNATNAILGNSFTLGPVLNADRQNLTTLVFRQINATIPIGARYFTLLITMTRYSGGYTNAVVDNISLVLYKYM